MYGGLSVVIVILVVDRLHAGDEATGFMWAAIGVGGVVGAVISGSIALRPNLGAFTGHRRRRARWRIHLPGPDRMAAPGDGRGGDRGRRHADRRSRRHDGLPACRARRDPRSNTWDDADDRDTDLCGRIVPHAGPGHPHRRGPGLRRRRRGDHRHILRDVRAGRSAFPAGRGRRHSDVAARLSRPGLHGRLPAALEVAAGASAAGGRSGHGRHPRGRPGRSLLHHRIRAVRRRPAGSRDRPDEAPALDGARRGLRRAWAPARQPAQRHGNGDHGRAAARADGPTSWSC